MWKTKDYFLFFCKIFWVLCLTEASTLRYCVPHKTINGTTGLGHACANLYTKHHAIQCVTATDRFGCFELLTTGKVDFMVAEPEDFKAFNETNLIVTHQLKKFAKSLPQRDIEMVAIVKSNFNNSWTIKGKKLCYAGFEFNSAARFDYHYTSYFESWLFPQNCNSKMTYLENRISSLAENFESACIAGLWSLDRKIDAELKAKYKNLCALCSDPPVCSETDRYFGINGALECLSRGIGDVAWLSRSDAMKYFSKLASSGYTLLCPDGTFKSLTDANTNKTCTWITDPRPVIVANKNIADIVYDKVTDKDAEGVDFHKVIHSSYKFSYLEKVERKSNIKDYLLNFPGYYSASIKARSTCRTDRNIRWCVSSALEERKCKSLQKASDALKLKPTFSCIKKPNRTECIRAISTGICDVFVTQPNEAYGIEKLGVKSIIELMANKKSEANHVAAIVNKNSTFKTFADLKGSNACFTGYQSIGWNSFLAILRNESAKWNCSDISVISNFFKNSCVLGLNPKDYKFPKNLHSLCSNNNGTKLGFEEKTFKCLMDGADVAFVNVSAAKAYLSNKSVFNIKYKILSSTNHSRYLTKVSLGSIVVHKNLTKVKEDDMYLMFLSLDHYFGRTYDRETPMFQMYGSYEGQLDVIFPAATMKLERTEFGIQYNKYKENIEFSKISCRVLNNRANDGQAIFTIIVFSLTTTLYFYYLHRVFI